MGLYPDTPHNEGLDAIRRALDKRDNQETPTNLIVDLAELVFRNNNFEFHGKHFLQILGTAIGTKMAPAYANLFMDELERRLISQARVKPYVSFFLFFLYFFSTSFSFVYNHVSIKKKNRK